MNYTIENTENEPLEETPNVDYVEGHIKQVCADHIIFLDNKNLINFKLNDQLFEYGINDVSRMCGSISALASVGVSITDAFNYIVEKEATEMAIKNNLDVAESNNKASVECSKYNKLTNSAKEI